MMRASSILGIVAAAALLAACGSRQEPEQPAPEPAPPPQREAPPPPPPPPARNDDAERLAREAEERARALRADLTSPIHFDFDRADVRAGTDQAILDRKAAVLNANPSVRLRISGHADERGSDEYNLALGNRRGAAAKRYLAGKGIADSRLEVVSYGEERPANPGHDEAAWAENRRDEFELTAGGDNLNAP
ncbi:MAG TPA: peptidoglycan-associated lipoprotein Pal [Gemmatimonadales bacterium]|nr:peptidoglycan-associated lipoprotein Pal [Gemmatimonadales bacterium]